MRRGLDMQSRPKRGTVSCGRRLHFRPYRPLRWRSAFRHPMRRHPRSAVSISVSTAAIWISTRIRRSRSDGGVIGGHAGYNYFSGQVLLGVEADLDWSSASFSQDDAFLGSSCRYRICCERSRPSRLDCRPEHPAVRNGRLQLDRTGLPAPRLSDLARNPRQPMRAAPSLAGALSTSLRKTSADASKAFIIG